jgi:tetratricopeptide (TPR) repeat protein
LVLSAVGCESRETVSIVTGNATDQSTVLSALTKRASTLRKNLGESVATLQKYQTPGELASTPSLEAWKAYSQGREEMVGRSDSAAAVPFFRHAIDLDSKFAMAYAALGTCYFNMGQKQLAAENTTTAFRLRDKVSEREKYYIESHYYHLAIGDLQQARNVYVIWARTYTQDTVPQTNLGEIYGQLGQHESCLDAYKKGLDLAPGSGLNYGSLFDTYVNLDRFQEAQDVLEQMKKTKTSSNDLRHHVYQLAFYQNDQDAMARQTEWASSNPDDSGVILHFAAETSALRGQLGQAREWTRKAVDSVRLRPDMMESAAAYEAASALREALFGNVIEARRYASEASRTEVGREVQYATALALAFTGKEADKQVERLSRDLARRFPRDTLVQSHFLPTIKAQQLLNRHEPKSALDALEVTSAYELGVAGVTSFSPNLYPIYLRGEAYLMDGNGKQAENEFKKILKHRGLTFNEPICVLARLGVARAQSLKGDQTAARQSYRELLEIWKEADASVPFLLTVRREYHKYYGDEAP